MRYKLLGKSGVRLSEVALGTMTFGEDWGWGASPAVSARMLDLFADAGGNVIDTADVYTGGSSETILGELLKGRRDRFVLGTTARRLSPRSRRAWADCRPTASTSTGCTPVTSSRGLKN
jgi:aryl-alcohol dehydrogenase-like predicted oxidoreductase